MWRICQVSSYRKNTSGISNWESQNCILPFCTSLHRNSRNRSVIPSIVPSPEVIGTFCRGREPSHWQFCLHSSVRSQTIFCPTSCRLLHGVMTWRRWSFVRLGNSCRSVDTEEVLLTYILSWDVEVCRLPQRQYGTSVMLLYREDVNPSLTTQPLTQQSSFVVCWDGQFVVNVDGTLCLHKICLRPWNSS